MKKKILSILLAFCMAAGTMAVVPETVNVQAAEEETVEAVGDELRYGNYQYQVQQDGTVMITKYYDDGTTSIVIPSEIDGKKVTSIGLNAFIHCKSFTSVTIPDTVIEIGSNVFVGCTNMKTVTIPKSVVNIGDAAFYDCNSLTNVTIPDSVTSIGDRVFYNCSSLENVTIQNSFCDIGTEAFYGTMWLYNEYSKTDSFVIVNHILIDSGKYSKYNEITTLTIPDSVTGIAGGVFSGFDKLTSITIPSSVKNIGNAAFYYCSGLTDVAIPDSVISIGDNAFCNCTGLVNISIPASVTKIGSEAFQGTIWLANEAKKTQLVEVNHILIDGTTASGNVSIPNFITYIAGRAFYQNDKLNNITIPDSVTGIGEESFAYCSNLTGVTIPFSVTEIGEYAFAYCNKLAKVIIMNSNTRFSKTWSFFNSPNVSISYGDQNQNTDNNSTENNNNGQKIIALSTIKSSVTSVTYTGKSQQPAVVITDTTGQTVDPSNYTLTYSNNKNVGQAAVTATGIGNYTGTLTAVFNIVPKGTNLSKVTAKKKSFLAKWKKQSAQTSGYELQYATNAKFKGAKIKTVKKNKTTSIAVKKLKSKKKYYVRVRTYKTVKINGKSMKLYSNWSKAKKVKVK